MRSSRFNKRALEQTDQKGWPRKQEVEELDVPGNKAVTTPKAAGCECGTEGCENCGTKKTADWVSDLIKQTVLFLTQHKNESDLAQKVKNLPIARRIGGPALEGAINNFQQSGNSSALSGELETILQGKRSMASLKKAESDTEVAVPKKEKTEGEQPESFVDPKRPEPAEKSPEPSADNTKGNIHRRVKLDSVEHGAEAPSTWAVDNTREPQHKANKKATPTAWSVDNTRQMPGEEKEMNTEEQMEQKKNASDLEVYTPKTAEEVDMVVQASGDWVAARMAKGVFAGQMPRFIINASEAVAIVSAQGDVFDKTSSSPTNKYASVLNPKAPKIAAAGGAAEEEETEEETSVDSVVVSLLEACKNEWTSLGDPVNPSTWPKEIERAILSLNDDIVAAIQKVEDKLVEGEFYSKNVDEGVEGHGGSSLDSLNMAPSMDDTTEPDLGLEDEPEMGAGDEEFSTAADEADEEVLPEPKTGGLKKKVATELPDVTSANTRKALKHTQSLKDDIAEKFFQFKKVVQEANDSSLVKHVGEVLVGLKTKLEEVEKFLSKQLQVLETAETAIDDKRKEKKSSLKSDCDGDCGANCTCKKKEEPKTSAKKTAACPTCGAQVMQNGKDTNGTPCPNCANKPSNQPTAPAPQTPVGTTPAVNQNGPAKPSAIKQYGSLLKGLTLATGE